MIVNKLNFGSGLGNQLWCYAVTRVIALDNGYDFAIQRPDLFKGKALMELDFGLPVAGLALEGWNDILPENIEHYYKENLIRNRQGIDISPADQNLVNIDDYTKIDGNFQALSYIQHRRNEIIKWMVTRNCINTYSSNDITIIHLRGGDYIGSPANTFLPFSYYTNAMNRMVDINPNMRFGLLSDDKEVATAFCQHTGISMIGTLLTNQPDQYKSPHHLGGNVAFDYSIINNAKNIILSNSTFGWWAAWTNTKVQNVIAPKYWMTYNDSDNYWSTADMRVPEWKYLDRNGGIS